MKRSVHVVEGVKRMRSQMNWLELDFAINIDNEKDNSKEIIAGDIIKVRCGTSYNSQIEERNLQADSEIIFVQTQEHFTGEEIQNRAHTQSQAPAVSLLMLVMCIKYSISQDIAIIQTSVTYCAVA